MKPTTYMYGALAVAAIIIIVLLVRGGSPSPQAASDAVASCIAHGGTYDVGSQTCRAGSGSTGGTVTGLNQSKTSGTSGTGGTVSTRPGYYSGPTPSMLPTYPDMTSPTSMVALSSPGSNTTVTSPLTISGQARGSWFFEAVFPVYLTDASGRILAQGQARAQSNWQTTDFVPFLATLTFSRQPTGGKGMLILKNANPSGSSGTAKAVEEMVSF